MDHLEISSYQYWALQQAESIEGFMSLNELAWLYEHARGKAVEMGSYRGRSTTAIGLKLKHTGGHLSCVDCFSEVGQIIFQENLDKSKLSVQLYRMRSVEAIQYFSDESLDFIFIDSSHEYDDTLDEITGWLPKLKRDGLLCGHDFNHPDYPGLTQAVNELCPGYTNPIDSIWCLRNSSLSEAHRHLLEVIRRSRQAQDSPPKSANQVEPQQSQEAPQFALHESREELKDEARSKNDLQKKLKDLRKKVFNLKSQNRALKQQLRQANRALEGRDLEIKAMKSSKFWKLRSFWFKVKETAGLSQK